MATVLNNGLIWLYRSCKVKSMRVFQMDACKEYIDARLYIYIYIYIYIYMFNLQTNVSLYHSSSVQLWTNVDWYWNRVLKHIYMCVCVYVWLWFCVCMCVCIYVCVYVCMYVCMYKVFSECRCLSMQTDRFVQVSGKWIRTYIYIYICIYINVAVWSLKRRVLNTKV